MTLYMVSIPIGHPDDITLRAIETLQKADFVVCEETKIGRRFLKHHKIEKPLFNMNEHNEKESSEEIIQLLLSSKKGAYFSDAGTPLFADPGAYLVNRCHMMGIRVVPIPGPSSLTAALAVAGVDIKQFYYAGFLPRVSEERKAAICKLKKFDCPIIIYDTPYRLKALLDDIKSELTAKTNAVLLLSLTQPEEQIIKGSISDIIAEVNVNYRKREFVLIVESPQKRQQKKDSRSRKSGKSKGKRR